MTRRLAWMLAGLLGCASEGVAPEPAPSDAPNSADSAWVPAAAASETAVLEVPARVVVPPEAVAELSTTYRLQVDEVLVRPGDRVEAGDPLVRGLAPDLLQAAVTRRSAEAQLAVVVARRDRLVELRRDGLVEQSKIFELDVAVTEAQTRRDGAAAVLRAAGLSPSAQTTVGRHGRVTLTSPIDGVVRRVDVALGQVREAAAPAMVDIVGEGPRRVQARWSGVVPEGAQFQFVGADGSVVALTASPPTSLVVPEDGSVLAWWDVLEGGDALAPGTLGRVVARLTDPALRRVPTRALRHDVAGVSVLVRDDAGVTRSVAVQVVLVDGTDAVVRGAIEPGTLVAADAALVLDAPESAS